MSTSSSSRKVTLIPGDGIGPEVVTSTRRIIEAAGVKLDWEVCDAGAEVFKRGLQTGVPRETIDSITRTRLVLKGPLETPVGYGEKSANVTLRKLFETFGNIRPVREFPGVRTPYAGRNVDLVIVRENVEDLYAGIEHMQSPGVGQCLKVMSEKGCEKIVRLAFEVAISEGRKSVHCATKANIMKMTEGLMKRVFERVAKEYPQIQANHIIVDNCAHQLVKTPEQFEVIVTSNMNGDILSDLTSGLIGGLGFAPGANLGYDVAIFEAVHGSAPKYAGKDTINPTAVLLSGVMMLRYIDEFNAAQAIENAVLVTLENGVYTRDVNPNGSVGTKAFTDAIIGNLGKKPVKWKARERKPITMKRISAAPDMVKVEKRRLLGADVFVEYGGTPDALGKSLEAAVQGSPIKLKMISNRGTMVYPAAGAMLDCVDVWRCRFITRDGNELKHADIEALLGKVSALQNWVHVEKLQEFNGAMAYTKAQGED